MAGGRPLRRIADSLGVDRNTVRKYVALAIRLGYFPGEVRLSAQEWAAIMAQDAPELSDPARRSLVFAEIGRHHEAIVAGQRTNTVTTVWQRLHDEQGLRASVRSFRRYVARYVPEQAKRAQPTVRRDDPPPGQEAQVDFGYLGLWLDPQVSKQRKLWAFSMVLSYSRHMFAYVVTRLDQQGWLQAHTTAFGFFGGTPAILVIDNLTPGVLGPDLYDPQINRSYTELAAHYGVLIDPCRVGRPNDKPRVERPMPHIRDSFFAVRTFDSPEDMNQAAAKWCLSVAGDRLHRTTQQRPLDLFLGQEAPALRSLPVQPFEVVTWTQGKVARDCHVQVGRSFYSVPSHYIGRTLAVRLSQCTVEFYLDQELVKTHRRPTDRQRQTDWNDHPPKKAIFFQRNPYWRRDQAGGLGPGVAQVVEGLRAQYALHLLRRCQGIIRLAVRYGPARLNAACQLALAYGDPTYQTVRNILHPDLLIIDDFCLRERTPQQAEDIFELIGERHRKLSTMIASNRGPQDWYPLFPNPVLAEAALVRLIDRSHHLVLEGRSYRPLLTPDRMTLLAKGTELD